MLCTGGDSKLSTKITLSSINRVNEEVAEEVAEMLLLPNSFISFPSQSLWPNGSLLVYPLEGLYYSYAGATASVGQRAVSHVICRYVSITNSSEGQLASHLLCTVCRGTFDACATDKEAST